jgi:mono/diheme cytochrome c family protein
VPRSDLLFPQAGAWSGRERNPIPSGSEPGRTFSQCRGRSLLFVKLLGILIALLGSALITVSGEQSGSAEKWIAPAAEARKKNPVAVSESSLATGQKIYVRRCVACHGKTGNGDGPDAADLGIHPAKLSDPVIRQETDGELFWKITVGKKPMPNYGTRLLATDRWNVINYLRSLARR